LILLHFRIFVQIRSALASVEQTRAAKLAPFELRPVQSCS